MQTIGTVSVLTATVIVALACNDRSGQTPTEPAMHARNAQASLQQGVGRGDDGSGSHFRVIGNARVTRDPENPSNIVLEVNSDGLTPVGVERELRRVQLWQLDHQLNFHRAFVLPHSCGGGSPRIILRIDADGDGDADFSGNGHVRPPYQACESSAPTPNAGGPAPSTLFWRFEDVTDELPRWEVTGGTVPGIVPNVFVNWDSFEQLVSAAFPNHRVVRARLIEDFNNTGPGRSYYDLITIFDLTLGTRGQWQPESANSADNRDN